MCIKRSEKLAGAGGGGVVGGYSSCTLQMCVFPIKRAQKHSSLLVVYVKQRCWHTASAGLFYTAVALLKLQFATFLKTVTSQVWHRAGHTRTLGLCGRLL